MSLTQVYGVSPAAMGSAVNASTLGMAIAGLGVAILKSSPGLRSCPDQCRQCRESSNLAIRRAGQPLTPLGRAVAPDDLHPERGCRIGVPAVRRHEGDGIGRNAEVVDRELVDSPGRLEGAYLLHRQHGIEQAVEPRGADGGREHGWRAIRQDGGLQSGRPHLRQHLGHVGKGREREVEFEQAAAQPWRLDP
jgi:hypothetical protein